jgi:hypothetical protein
MNKDTQLIWEAFLGESYFDSWQLPAGHEDWRVKNKNENGVIKISNELAFDLMSRGSKPMTMLDSTDEKQAKMISHLQKLGFDAIKGDKHPDPDLRNQVFVGISPEWVEKGIQAWYDSDHIELGKALGFGEHSLDLDAPEQKAKAHAKRDKQDKELKQADLIPPDPYDPPEL